ncbi:MAG: glycosyltransferase family 2 protein, partial [Muribaculaceae bacterium]|nr:glycosyltransferase family 2 protein [Muribaculaceae bacterium]
MKTTINCFVPFADANQAAATVSALRESSLVSKIYLLATDQAAAPELGCDMIHIDSLNSSATMKKIAEAADADYILLYTKYA